LDLFAAATEAEALQYKSDSCLHCATLVHVYFLLALASHMNLPGVGLSVVTPLSANPAMHQQLTTGIYI